MVSKDERSYFKGSRAASRWLLLYCIIVGEIRIKNKIKILSTQCSETSRICNFVSFSIDDYVCNYGGWVDRQTRT